MSKEMLINTIQDQECRIAIVKDGLMDELYVERDSFASHVGNIYKAKVTNVEASIQAAFVDFGLAKNGFLHITDIHPQYFPKGKKSSEPIGRKCPHRDRPPIQACLRRGQEVVVQMTKEGIGTKGPTMTTYLSIPGRLLVMLPGMSRMGISRKIEDEELRARARKTLAELSPPPDMGFICRTAGADRPKRELQRDLNYLLRLWKSVEKKIKSAKTPAEIYQESDLVIRTLRDVYNTDIGRIICDSEAVAGKAEDFLRVAMPRTRNNIELYTGKGGLFHDTGLEEEIESIYSRRVELPSGGSLVIDQTEALVAIDVNSGRFRVHSNAEMTALKTNLEAAKEIGRQLRLRDMGGVIVMDFIDMREQKNRRSVEKAIRDAVKDDRAKTKILRTSDFGTIEMTRQRLRPSLKSSMFSICRHCEGAGLVKSPESLSLLVIRDIHRATGADDVAEIVVAVHPEVANQLANFHRKQLCSLENQTGIKILVQADTALGGAEVKLVCRNARGSEVSLKTPKKTASAKHDLETKPFEAGKGRPAPEPDELDDFEELEEPTTPPTDEEPAPARKKSRRRRRSSKKDTEKAPEQAEEEAADKDDEEPAPARKKSRRRRRSSKKDAEKAPEQTEEEAAEKSDEEPAPARKKSRRRRRSSKKDAEKAPEQAVEEAAEKTDEEPAPAQKKSRRRRRSSKKDAEKAPEQAVETTDDTADADEKPKPRRRRKAAKKAEGDAKTDKEPAEKDAPAEAPPADADADEPKPKKKRTRGRRGGRKHRKKTTDKAETDAPATDE
jgi:ribonuclease E